MCDSCNCGTAKAKIITGHHHHHKPSKKRTIQVKKNVLSSNQEIAEQNRTWFKEHHITVINMVSSPGSGKTTLLEHSLKLISKKGPVAVIEGDQQTSRDADRIATTGVPVLQVNTGAGCHLDASMIARAITEMNLVDNSLLFIENVGNLVCPASFDLGEDAKVVILSVTEGDDKPQKYPQMFNAAKAGIITKTDLLPHVNFDMASCRTMALEINPKLHLMELSATTGLGLDSWLSWLDALKS